MMIELTWVTAADTKLVAALVEVWSAAQHLRVQLHIRVSEPVARWLQICRIDWIQSARTECEEMPDSWRSLPNDVAIIDTARNVRAALTNPIEENLP
ncbi:MAG: hypothetical protein KF724_09950 [Phycisphaeraceae bacterium]|nr:hypothetical protein [Phycisphaeraceae bacterium]